MRTAPQQLLALPADRYSIEREIGRGGYATVYLARDLRHQRSVAIKVLNQALASEVGLERFQAEIDVAASLAHPNIVPVFDSGAAGDTLYYVMPLVEGESLRQRLEREGALAVEDAMRIARDMAHALAYAHSRNVVHRDIKPENILLMQSGGHALVADFGIAKVLSGARRGRLTVTGSAIGTPLYMSPEQSVGLPVDARSDIYSFAAVVFEMLTGMPPMPGSGARDLLTDTPTGEMPSRVSRPARLPRLVRPVLARALAGDAEDRQNTVAEFMSELSGAIDHGDGSLLRRFGLGHVPWPRRRVAQQALGGAAALVVIAAGLVYAVEKSRGADAEEGRIVIFPFRTTTQAAIGWREAIPDLIATQLDGTPGVRVADPWSIWLPLRRDRGD
ncbi:MAG TPA: serine/threonine-protein kinase, partial [Gemmatimonadaceae bacterium]|nr:serine/threonine-protein kinase [Gemmatimonadaceae bacterium]